jgi:hypothetical protein
MRRREFITLLSGTAAAWPLAARAQQPTMPLIGFLSSVSASVTSKRISSFGQGLSDAGIRAYRAPVNCESLTRTESGIGAFFNGPQWQRREGFRAQPPPAEAVVTSAQGWPWIPTAPIDTRSRYGRHPRTSL